MKKKNDRKTRQFRDRSDFVCPAHGLEVVQKVKLRVDEQTGKERYGGEYLGCPRYGECGYYVSYLKDGSMLVKVLE